MVCGTDSTCCTPPDGLQQAGKPGEELEGLGRRLVAAFLRGGGWVGVIF